MSNNDEILNQVQDDNNKKHELSHDAEAMRGKMEKIVSLCKRRGFVFNASEIYGGFANAFDYGPLGAELKRNIKNIWWQEFVDKREDVVGLDSAIIQNPKVWEASGHTGEGFTDPLVECKKCHKRFRSDHLKENKCPECGGELTEEKPFNVLVKTYIGAVEDDSTMAYLRGETAQGIFINFKNVLDSSRVKIPFGIAQIGKAFRNEITTGNFIFRTREFEQAEIEYFVEADEEESKKWYQKWIGEYKKFYTTLGIKEENLTLREHDKDELSHYSIGTTDIEYKFPFGVSELAGIAQRTDYDLKQHEKYSKQNLEYFDQEGGKKYIPYVVEPSLGLDRAFLAVIADAYRESDGSDGRSKGEVVLGLDPKVAPYQIAVFPLMNKKGLPEMARKMYHDLRESNYRILYDDGGSIGKRYRRQDEIGTPYCITVDFDSLDDDTVTVRDRDTLRQERIKITELKKYIAEKI